MDERFDTDDMSPDLRLTAIVTLLSASALRGPTVAKTGALRAHLDAILADAALPTALREALEQALAGWRAVECHPASISAPLCPLTTSGQSLH